MQISLAEADHYSHTTWILFEVVKTDMKPELTNVRFLNPQSWSTRFIAVWHSTLMNVGPWWKANQRFITLIIQSQPKLWNRSELASCLNRLQISHFLTYFTHLRSIYEDPDCHQNSIICSSYHHRPLHKISSRSVHNFMSNVANRQTSKQTPLKYNLLC